MSKTLEFRWSTSRGRDTYGYPVCTLYINGIKVASCNGGGYDMRGTNLGTYIARAYRDRLLTLKAEDMPAQSHWERAEQPRKLCENVECLIEHGGEHFPPDTMTCPHCGAATRIDYHDSKTIDEGRYFYGLTYHDPNYDPGKGIIGRDASDRTLSGNAEGMTVAEAEQAGKSFGLERYQAIYSASSKAPTERHTVPHIDGGCGQSSVEKIMSAVGLTLEYVSSGKGNSRNSTYILRDSSVI